MEEKRENLAIREAQRDSSSPYWATAAVQKHPSPPTQLI